MEAPWLRAAFNPFLSGLPRALLKVADLFIQGTHCWDQLLIISLMILLQKKVVRVKPLPAPRDDILIWKAVKFDNFYIKDFPYMQIVEGIVES